MATTKAQLLAMVRALPDDAQARDLARIGLERAADPMALMLWVMYSEPPPEDELSVEEDWAPEADDAWAARRAVEESTADALCDEMLPL